MKLLAAPSIAEARPARSRGCRIRRSGHSRLSGAIRPRQRDPRHPSITPQPIRASWPGAARAIHVFDILARAALEDVDGHDNARA
ncbi:MAG: hypothetical protein MZV49_15180 [Rhodopseudomonas palustris]|nr:hypothetical protein [Rhodopseudomonas palustris]